LLRLPTSSQGPLPEYMIYTKPVIAGEALKPHQQAALAENAVKAGIAAVKYGVSLFSAKATDIENAEELLQPRRPYEAPSEAAKRKIKEALTPVNEVELKLQSTKAWH
jgi:4-hydroxy-2-oxoglutarate aldolase